MSDFSPGTDPFGAQPIASGIDPFEPPTARLAPNLTQYPAGEKVREAMPEFTQGLTSTPARLARSVLAASRAVGGSPSPQLAQAVEDLSHYPDSPAGRLGALGGDVVATLAMPARGLAGMLAQSTLGAALSPDNPALGAALPVLGAGLDRVARGVPVSRDAQALIDRGIQPSAGQAAGGWLNNLEQRAASFLPGVARARSRPLEEFGEQAIRRATRSPAITTLDDANAYASQLYDDVVPHLTPTRQAVVGVQRALADAMRNPEMTDQARTVLHGLVNKHFATFGQLDGAGIKTLDSQLGWLVRKYARGSPAEQTLADEIGNVQRAFREGLEFGLPIAQLGQLAEANRVWRDLIPLNKAASARGDELITPRALQRAIASQRRTDPSRLPPDDLIDPALRILPSTVPDSGTAGRLALPGGVAAAMANPLATIATLGGSAALSTRLGQQALTGQLPYQQMMAAALRRVLTPVGTQLDNEP